MVTRVLLALSYGWLILQPASGASASLLELDLLTAGDGLVTRDTETGLDWLDLTATLNLSYNDIEADLGGWISLGFRHATGLEACGSTRRFRWTLR